MASNNAVRADRRVLPAGATGDLAVRPPFGAGVQERLKAERVQERLKALPGWALSRDGEAVDRVREFADPAAATAYAAFAAALAGSRAQPIALSIDAGKVVLTLPGQKRRGLVGGLDDTVLDLAASLG